MRLQWVRSSNTEADRSENNAESGEQDPNYPNR